jgi:hypothetical protein
MVLNVLATTAFLLIMVYLCWGGMYLYSERLDRKGVYNSHRRLIDELLMFCVMIVFIVGFALAVMTISYVMLAKLT